MKSLKCCVLGVVLLLSQIISVYGNSCNVYAQENNAGYLNLIYSYYDLINDDNAEDIVYLYGESLRSEVFDFFTNNSNKVNGEGIFGVESVEIMEMKAIETGFEYEYGNEIYHDTMLYFVKSKMSVDNSDKYYSNGINYFQFYIGVDENGQMKIANVEIPLYNVIINNDSDMESVNCYINNRNVLLYGDEILNNGISLCATTSESPVWSENIYNPAKIKVLLSDKKTVVERDLKDYCKTVAAGEITTLKNTEALRACALAIKMFAIHHILTSGSGVSYDINSTDQVFDESKVRKQACNAAVDYVFNYFLLDKYGCIFKTFYRKSNASTDGEFCKKNGGILSQLGADSLAADGNNWTYIMRYYYERKAGISYYNTAVSYGNLIITSAHTHNLNGNAICNLCGAVAK